MNSDNPSVFATKRRVQFCETDAAGIAHFSSFVLYMEQAEHDMLRDLGMSVVQPLFDGAHLSWPRVRVECDYQGAVRFEDVLQIQVRVMKLGTKSVTYGFEFSKDAKVVAKGQVVVVCCKLMKDRSLESTPIPEDVRGKLTKYLVQD